MKPSRSQRFHAAAWVFKRLTISSLEFDVLQPALSMEHTMPPRSAAQVNLRLSMIRECTVDIESCIAPYRPFAGTMRGRRFA